MSVHVVTEMRWHRHPAAISAQALTNAEQAVVKTLSDINGQAKQLVRVDTGNLKNSISTEMESRLAGTTGARDVLYAIYQEYGTYKMSGKPYMRPAAEQARPAFVAAMRQILG